jgi:hypothetical protein
MALHPLLILVLPCGNSEGEIQRTEAYKACHDKNSGQCQQYNCRYPRNHISGIQTNNNNGSKYSNYFICRTHILFHGAQFVFYFTKDAFSGGGKGGQRSIKTMIYIMLYRNLERNILDLPQAAHYFAICEFFLPAKSKMLATNNGTEMIRKLPRSSYVLKNQTEKRNKQKKLKAPIVGL